MSEYLLDKLNEYGASDFYPLHMPGHKRRISHFGDPFAIDITEIDGFDDLHHAQGILLEAQRRAARLYGAEETYYLVNGSTCGILTAVAASTTKGSRILMARNSHKSCYHAAFLNDLHVTYVYPPVAEMDAAAASAYSVSGEGTLTASAHSVSGEGTLTASARSVSGEETLTASARSVSDGGVLRAGKGCGICGSIRPEDIAEALRQNPDIRAVLVTSPTYDGVVSDIGAIAEAVHNAGAILIVDEAHGAHFGMHPYFPRRALACGADIVINSLHKTLPSLTQTALLHVQGDRVDREKLRKYLDIYQTSSPSYVLMAGMDACIRLLEEQGRELFDTFAERLEQMRGELRRKLRILRLIDGACSQGRNEAGQSIADLRDAELPKNELIYDFDRSKVLISTERCEMTGPQLADILRKKYHLESEMAAANYVTAIMTIADEQEGFDRLAAALLEIDTKLTAESKNALPENSEKRYNAQQEYCTSKNALPENLEKRYDVQQEHCVSKNVLTRSTETRTDPDILGSRNYGNEDALSIRQAQECPTEQMLLSDSAGRISAEYIYLYPPGIPLLVPGERIAEELLLRLQRERDAGLTLRGMEDDSGKVVRVVKEAACEPE